MPDDDRQRAQAQADPPEGVIEGDASDDAGQRDRQDEPERDDVTTEEPVAVDSRLPTF